MLKFWKSIIWALLIAFLMIMPGDKIPQTKLFDFEHFDKIVHFALFLFFIILLLFEGKSFATFSNYRNIILITIALVYALVTELIQYILIIARNADWYDFIADATGITIGWIIFLVFGKLTKQTFYRSQ